LNFYDVGKLAANRQTGGPNLQEHEAPAAAQNVHAFANLQPHRLGADDICAMFTLLFWHGQDGVLTASGQLAQPAFTRVCFQHIGQAYDIFLRRQASRFFAVLPKVEVEINRR